MTEQVDFAQLAQQYRDEGAEEWVIWLAGTCRRNPGGNDAHRI